MSKMTKIFNFEIKQRVWPIYCGSITVTSPCRFCTQTGVIVGHDNSKGECPKCGGRGNIKKYCESKEWRLFDEYKIVGVKIGSFGEITWELCSIYDESEDRPMGISDYNIFSSEEEAKKTCAERNSKIK